jgi:HK97 gp10 family phage protein
MQQFENGVQSQVHKQLTLWTADVEALAKQLAPVKTGRLRSSIYARVQEWVAGIGAEVSYALFVEFGTRHVQARPYLYPALEENLPRLEQTINEAIDSAKTEAGL